jgi:hypothetical protein
LAESDVRFPCNSPLALVTLALAVDCGRMTRDAMEIQSISA